MLGLVFTVVSRVVWTQSIRRHYLATALELVFVLACCYLLINEGGRPKPGTLHFREPRTIITEPVTLAHTLNWTVALYGPSKPYTDDLIRKAFHEHQDLVSSIPSLAVELSANNESVCGHMPLKLGSDVFAACDNATAIPDSDDEDNDTASDVELIGYRKKMEEQKALRQFKGRIVCVRFGDDTDAESPSLEYTLHFFVSAISDDFLKLNRPKNFFLPETYPNDAELLDKLHGVQIRINRAHLELQNEQHTWNPTWNYTTYQRFMPLPEFPTEPRLYRPGVVVAAIALLWLFFRHLTNLTRETSSGLKELQCVMGLPDAVYWIGHYLSFLVLILAESMIVLVYMVTIKHSDLGVVFLENAAVSLLLAAFLIYCLLLPLLILLLSCVSPKGVYASLLGLAFYLVLPFIYLDAISWIHRGVGDYIFFGRSTKLLSCIFPQLGICLVLQGISLENDYIGNAGWGIIDKRALGLDNVTIIEIWLVMVSSGLGVVVLIWYLTRVLPCATALPQSPLFPLMPSYWSPPAPVRTAENLTADHNPSHFEGAPNNAEPVIVTRDLIKNFWTTKALDGVDLEIYESQITVLLGHNGAGKSTLMNILTGMLKPSGGVALVCGYDIVKNTAHARKSLGFCQQGDVFFTDLTTWEHVVYFAKLKGLGRTQAQTQAQDTLTAVGLDSKLNELPQKLSGGMKRRLSIAMAVVSNPKVVLLDEPTAGLDPENKREVWDLLLGMRAKTTLIISTHDMDEADVLADRIVVMAEGRALCSGSPAFLKKSYGVGYQLRILKKPGTFALLTVVNIIKKTAPNAEENEKQNEVIVTLNTLSHRGFVSMFKELELHQSSLGIGAIGVTVATMRDVYVKINLECQPAEAREKDDKINDKDVAYAASAAGTGASETSRLLVLMWKRAICFQRSYFTIFTAFVLPAILFLLLYPGNRKGEISNHQDQKSTHVPMSLKSLFPGAVTFAQHDAATREYFEQYRPLVESEEAELKLLPNATQTLLDEASRDYLAYTSKYILGGVFEEQRLEGWYNPFAALSKVISLNLLDTALIRLQSGNRAARIRTNLYVHEDIFRDLGVSAKFKALVGALFSGIMLYIDLYHWFLYTPMIVGVLCANFVLFPFVEHTCRAKALQLMTGVPGLVYCLSNFLFDLVVYLAAFLIVAACLVSLYKLRTVTYVGLLVVVLAHSGIGILVPYLIAARATSENHAYVLTLLFWTIGGTVSPIALILLRVFTSGLLLRWIPLFLPPVALPGAIYKLMKLEMENDECLRLKRQYLENSTLLEEYCQTGYLKEFGYGFERCCEHAEKGYAQGFQLLSPFELGHGGIVFNIIVMLLEGALFFALLVWWDSANFVPTLIFGTKDDVEDVLDSEVQAEKDLVDDLCSRESFSEHALVAHNVHKFYGSLHAVRGLNFAVVRGECFGLLGVNGAGKTTTFQVLTALEQMTDGDAYMQDGKLSQDPRRWQSHIGYCLQSGGLLEQLDAYQFLRLFASLRGVKRKEIKKLVNSVISIVGLKQYAKKKCGSYSGGNKRKLSVAAAFIGLPEIVFLDEPSAGVDILARQKIFSSLQAFRSASGLSLVLTSHSMDECELACDRIGIMVAGQFKCLGSLQHLKSKFGTGYSLNLRLEDGSALNRDAFVAEVQRVFPGIQLRARHEDTFEYHMEEKLLWSVLFTKVEELERQFKLAHVLASDSTLEQIFIQFAREQDSKVGVATSVAKGPVLQNAVPRGLHHD